MTLTLIYIIQYLSTLPSGSIYHITCLVVETGKGLLLLILFYLVHLIFLYK